MIKKNIVLRLLSDTLPGNGEGLAGIVDNDVCFDDFGLPYIPARRIKGIIRETAQQLNYFATDTGITNDVLARLFQASGSSLEAEFCLGNGYLKNRLDLQKYLQYASTQPELSKRFSPQAVLSLYTYTRSQTSLEDGIAKENTLRQSRVLKKGLEFVFDCRIEENLLPYIGTVIKLVKNMGLNRSRGLGEIALELQDQTADHGRTTGPDANFKEDSRAALRLRIHNVHPLLLSAESGKTQESQNYIPGSVILGACATQYIQAQRHTNHDYDPDADKDFLAMFVDGSVSWGNAYLWVNQKASLPIPLSWKKDKQSGRIFNLADDTERTGAENSATNLKGLGNAYYVRTGQDYSRCQPELKVEYHHRRPQDITKGSPDKNDGEFFQFEVIAEGQEFCAQIIGEYAYLKKIRQLLGTGEIWLGKSRSAQYAYCRVDTYIDQLHTELDLEKGDRLYLSLVSDTVIKNENGLSVVSIEALRSEFIGLWNKNLSVKVTEDLLKPVNQATFIGTNRLGGFMNIWKLHKIQEPVISAGSVIAFDYVGDGVDIGALQFFPIGQETSRGYGRFALSTEVSTGISFQTLSHNNLPSVTMPGEFGPIFAQALEAGIKAKAIDDSGKKFRSSIPASLIRRIMAAVEAGSHAPTGKAAEICNCFNAIKRLKDKKPGWIKHLEDLIRSEEYPDFLSSLMQNTAPDRNLATIETCLGINRTNKDSWFPLLELYCRSYLRNLTLLLRLERSYSPQEVNDETAE